MIYETYCKICKKHKVKPTQVIADGNIAQILNNDQKKHLKINEIYLDESICEQFLNEFDLDVDDYIKETGNSDLSVINIIDYVGF